jgi:inorganic pyrophosphatase
MHSHHGSAGLNRTLQLMHQNVAAGVSALPRARQLLVLSVPGFNMAPQSARHIILSETATFDNDSGDLRAVIETPKGSRNKYRYNPACDCFELATALPEGMTFPFDFGFVPSTLGDDGDPLDLLVLMDAPVPPGCLLRCRVIGVIEALQKDSGKDWEKNDRLIAVASHARTHEGIKSIDQLRPQTLEDIKAFFVDYNRLRDKKFKPVGEHGRRRATKLVKIGMDAFKRKHKDH